VANIRVFISEYIDEFTPMPKARVTIAMALKAGAPLRERIA
jgi:hypothetical protein